MSACRLKGFSGLFFCMYKNVTKYIFSLFPQNMFDFKDRLNFNKALIHEPPRTEHKISFFVHMYIEMYKNQGIPYDGF